MTILSLRRRLPGAERTARPRLYRNRSFITAARWRLRRLHLLSPRPRRSDLCVATNGRTKAWQGLVSPPRSPRLPRRHQSRRLIPPLAIDRAGAQSVAFPDPARLPRVGGVDLGGQGA